MNVIVITGNPGTGKTSICNILTERGYQTLSLFDFAKEKKCIDVFDEGRNSWVVEPECLRENLFQFLEETNEILVIEGHYGDLVPPKFVKKCFVIMAPLEELHKRYNKRGYSKSKIQENIEAQIMEECYFDALEEFGEERVEKLSGKISEMASVIENELNQLRN